jgi:hypothetical protein
MSDGAPIPSHAELIKLTEALQAFLDQGRSNYGKTWEQEDHLVPCFVRVAEALRPIRPSIDSVCGWPHRIGRALRTILAKFDEITEAWGWGQVAAPEPERSAYLKQRRAWFEENVQRPMFEAALSWQAGCRTLSCPIDSIADTGRERGYKATMTPEEGESRFESLQGRWIRVPSFGTCHPIIGDEDSIILSRACSMIDSVLRTRSSEPQVGDNADSGPPTGPAAPLPEGRNRHIEDAVDQPPPPRPEIDFKALASALRKGGKGTQAALVEFMADKEEAIAEEIGKCVHDDEKASDSAMWNNAKRTTESLVQLGSRLSFRFASGRMYREISPA